MDLDYLSGMGVRLCLQGHQPFMAAVQAVYDTLAALRAGTEPKELPGVAPTELMRRLTRGGDHEPRWPAYLAGRSTTTVLLDSPSAYLPTKQRTPALVVDGRRQVP